MSVNVPFQDDVDAILGPVGQWAAGVKGPVQLWEILTTQDDERRIIMVRLMAIISYSILGFLDFRVVAFLGIATYLVFLLLIFKWFKEENKVPFYLFLPVPFIIFTQVNFGALYQSMVPLQHIAVYVWAFASIWCLSRRTTSHFSFGILFGLLSVFSDVTGVLILVVGALTLVVQREKLKFLIWVILIAPTVILYFHNLVVPDFRPSMSDNLSHVDSMIAIVIAMPGMMADVFPKLPDDKRIWLALMSGLIILGFISYEFILLVKKVLYGKYEISSNEIWIWGCIVFLLLTFTAFAFGRAAEGTKSILLNRYKHMFLFWGVLNYLLFLKTSWIRGSYKKAGFICLGLSILFFVNGYFQVWGELDFFRKIILADAYGWSKNRVVPSAPIYVSVKSVVDPMYENSLNQGTYKFPEMPFTNLSKIPVKGFANVEIDNGPFISVTIPEFKRKSGFDDGAYVILKSRKNTHVLPAQNQQSSLPGFFMTGQFYQGHATSYPLLNQYLATNEEYEVILGVIDEGNKYLLTTGKKIYTDPVRYASH
ncbi:hypothetical protein [Dyadobacter sediminis]|uniref:Uncharacterized protein n=1 Tax=Dyadobacter sediminis TaxID=1493691 RepID=A0A5R9KEG2_9BACT|nr:hypothetical protein [Dyadobacter sediminis]TLU94457.1 hypothetical protein FEM55_09465 [Dyadobacter sediminis]GGB91074.1 hypothetical protein GCM10011325_18140 [Dyadobacter sediminis]